MSSLKEKLGEEVASWVKDGEQIGIGTGSTVVEVVKALGQRISKEKIKVYGVPSSRESAVQCAKNGILVLDIRSVSSLSWGFDGADAVDPNGNCIKGKGAALLEEKILASLQQKFYVLVDDSKCVATLDLLPIPIEVIPSAEKTVVRSLEKLGAKNITLREGTGKFGATITEHGNIILDASFSGVNAKLEKEITSIVGVVESGLFTNLVHSVVIAGKDGIKKIERKA